MSTAVDQPTAPNASEPLELIDGQFCEAMADGTRGTISGDERHRQPWRIRTWPSLFRCGRATCETPGLNQATRSSKQTCGPFSCTSSAKLCSRANKVHKRSHVVPAGIWAMAGFMACICARDAGPGHRINHTEEQCGL
jgi:hypothetical protein